MSNGQKYSLNAKYNTSPRMDNYKNGQFPTKTVDATVDITSNAQDFNENTPQPTTT